MNYEPPQKGFKTFILLLALGIGSFGIAQLGKVAISTYTSAAITEEPEHARITNTRTSMVTVSWHTSSPTTGYVYLTKGNQQWEEFSPYLRTNHHLTIEGLQPNTEYAVQIGVGKRLYVARGAETARTSFNTHTSTNHRVFGQVIGLNHTPAAGSLVYVTLKDGDNQGTSGLATVLSAITNAEGIYSVNLQETLVRDRTGPFFFSAEDDIVEITALGIQDESASILVLISQTQPAPSIQLSPTGTLQDLTNSNNVRGTSISLPPHTTSPTQGELWLRKQLLKLSVR
jgi:hypothetical protein